MSVNALQLFEGTLEWLCENYPTFRFFVERDVVWTVQNRLHEQISTEQLRLRVYNDFPILPGTRRSLSADLAILDEAGVVLVAAEFKYEPSHSRTDIWPTKFGPTVVFWDIQGVAKDVLRVHQFVAEGKARHAYAIFIDEGGYFRHREAHANSRWVDWEASGAEGKPVSILWTQVAQSESVEGVPG